MITAAIICEYNPFHKGHLYQIEYIKKELKADRIVCLMSGDFVQRGEPAILSKEIRTEMALSMGADLVLLLPAHFSTASADNFSYGAVSILNKLGCIDYLCFGAECPDLSLLTRISEEFSVKATPDNPMIKDLLSKGLTFGEARARVFSEYEDILKGPNNILAIEYLISLIKTKSPIKPFLVKRKGADYNSSSIDPDTSLQSATALRGLLGAGKFEEAMQYIPSDIHGLFSKSDIVLPEDLDTALFSLLLRESDLSCYEDVSFELSMRIKNKLCEYRGFVSFLDTLKTKNLTRARISRALIHILLNIKGSSRDLPNLADALDHIRIQGFKKDSSDLLTAIKKSGNITLVTKVPDVYDSLSAPEKAVFDADLYAATLYDSISACKNNTAFTAEYSKTIVIYE